MEKEIVKIACDVLCIGGGGAGITASIIASEEGVKVVLLSKEPIGYGNTRLVGGIIVQPGVNPKDSPELFFRDLILGGEFLNNQALCEVMVEEAPKAVKLLERFGGIVDRSRPMQIGGHSLPRTLLLPGTGPGLGKALRGALASSEVKILEEVIITKLFKKDKGVIGAAGMELSSGMPLMFNAKQIILATGGGGWLYYPNTDVIRGCTGEGYALAFRVGAELLDMEQVQFLPFAITHPPSMKGIMCGEPFTARPKGRLLNQKGEEILKDVASKTRAEVARAMVLAVEKGGGTKHGGVLLDLRESKGTPEGDFIYHHYTKGMFRNIGEAVRFAYGDEAFHWDEPWDVYPTAHYFMGGVRIDEMGRVLSVENLFAVGEVAGGLHGGNRLGSVSLAELFVFGAKAGKEAAKGAKLMDLPRPSGEMLKECERISRLRGRKGKKRPIGLKRRLQKAMWDGAGPIRDEKRLSLAKKVIDEIRGELEEIEIPSFETMNFDLLDALELDLMLDVAEAVVVSASQRKETRGAHIMLDHPERRDEEYLKNVILSRNEKGKIGWRFEPVNLLRIKP